MAEKRPEELRKLAGYLRPGTGEWTEARQAEWDGLSPEVRRLAYDHVATLLQLADALEARDMVQAEVAELRVTVEVFRPSAENWNRMRLRAERAEAERDVLRADHEANLTILTRLVMDLPMAAGFRGGCENFSEIFDLVVEEHQALRSTLAAVREKHRELYVALGEAHRELATVFKMGTSKRPMKAIREVRLALLDGTAPERENV